MSYQLLVPKKPAVDEQWHSKLHTILEGLPEIYNALEPSPDQLKKLHTIFIANHYSGNPNLRAQSSADRHIKVNQKLVQLKQEILESETDTLIRRAYADRIDELLGRRAHGFVGCGGAAGQGEGGQQGRGGGKGETRGHENSGLRRTRGSTLPRAKTPAAEVTGTCRPRLPRAGR